MHIFCRYGTVLTVVSSSLVISLEFLHNTSSLSFPQKIPVSAKQMSLRAWLWMLDIRAARCVIGLAPYKRVAVSPLERAKLGDARTLTCFAFLPTYFWSEKVTSCSLDSLWICVARFYSFCCARLLSFKPLVPRHTGSLIHFSCRIKNKEVHFS